MVRRKNLIRALMALLGLLCSLVYPFSFVGTTKAVSAYDDLVNTTSQLTLSVLPTSPCSGSHAVNVSTHWESDVYAAIEERVSLGHIDSDYLTSWNNKVDWSVVQNTAINSSWQYYTVYWTSTATVEGNFGGVAPNRYINYTGASNIYYLVIYPGYHASGSGDCTQYGDHYGRAVSWSKNLSNWAYSEDGPDLFVSTFTVNYPSGYEGEEIPASIAAIDMDGDGLIGSQESSQNTSDANKDTDGDGLNDYIESQWNTDRDNVFCGTQCAYPDPTVKDVYVEIDWMKDASNNIYKPSSMQLDLVEDMFDAQGINFHADTGQFGGGNELSSYEHTLPFAQNSSNFDFYDYKNGTASTAANFSSDRKRIWHYMISGYQYAENTGSSGVSYAGDDDFFVSYGLIKDGQLSFGYTTLDTAIAGTIAHELGHNLCLADASLYVGQVGECVYGGY